MASDKIKITIPAEKLLIAIHKAKYELFNKLTLETKRVSNLNSNRTWFQKLMVTYHGNIINIRRDMNIVENLRVFTNNTIEMFGAQTPITIGQMEINALINYNLVV